MWWALRLDLVEQKRLLVEMVVQRGLLVSTEFGGLPEIQGLLAARSQQRSWTRRPHNPIRSRPSIAPRIERPLHGRSQKNVW